MKQYKVSIMLHRGVRSYVQAYLRENLDLTTIPDDNVLKGSYLYCIEAIDMFKQTTISMAYVPFTAEVIEV